MPRRPSRPFTAAIAGAGAILLVALSAGAHDLFLRPRDFIVAPDADVDVRVLNGSFMASEAPVARGRLRDLSVVGPEGRAHPDTSAWSAAGRESAWRVHVGGAGTYVIGASVQPKTIRLAAPAFNAYLRDDGLPDALEERRRSGTLDSASHERYSKHVKALVRVEDSRRATSAAGDTAYRTPLGYPAELVTLDDPYEMRAGASLRVRAIVDGTPAAGQLVLAGGRNASGARIRERATRTDARGIASIPLRAPGLWYVKFIRMRAVSAAERDSVNYESKWATLTFAVRARSRGERTDAAGPGLLQERER